MSKLLALASSANDQEALAALRAARRMLAAEGIDFVDLAALIQDGGRTEALEEELETVRQRLQQTQAALHSLRQRRDGTAAERDLRSGLRRLAAENHLLKTELARQSEELDHWRAAHSALDDTLRQTVQERFQLRSRLRQQQKEMAEMLGDVRGMINVTNRLRNFVEGKSASA